jgi:hypothetical protein
METLICAGFLRRRPIRAGFDAVGVHVSLSGPKHPARYEELAAAADAHCPVLDLFRNPAPVERKLATNA